MILHWFIVNNLLKSPQQTIATLFGYKSLENVSQNAIQVKNNKSDICKCCGRMQDAGYLDPKNILISKKANNLYSFKNLSSPFYCAYCYFIQKNYYKADTNHMADIIVFNDRYETKDFKTDSIKNDLYEIFLSPPKPPFVLMLKEQITATTVVNMSHCVKPTIDKDLIVVNYGLTPHLVPRKLTIKCLKDFIKIKNKYDTVEHILSDEVLFNRTKSPKYDYWFSLKLRENIAFREEYITFLNNHNESIRFVAKIMLATYIDKIKIRN